MQRKNSQATGLPAATLAFHHRRQPNNWLFFAVISAEMLAVSNWRAVDPIGSIPCAEQFQPL
jgi:hypothetical protein